MSNNKELTVTDGKQTAGLVKAPGKKAQIAQLLESQKRQIMAALPKSGLTPDRLIRVALTAVSRQPKLLECTNTSLLGAIIQAAQLGLEPDGVLGHAYLIPFKRNFQVGNEWKYEMNVNMIIGYKGLIDLARRSGELSSIKANVVCEYDRFEYEFGLNEKLVHIPAEGKRGEIKHFYAYAKLKDGGFAFEVMSKSDVDDIMYDVHRKNNYKDKKKKNDEIEITGVWADYYEEMGKKTLIRRLAKYLPMSVEFAKAVQNAEMSDQGIPQFADITDIDTETGEILSSATYEEIPEDETHEEPKELKANKGEVVEEKTNPSKKTEKKSAEKKEEAVAIDWENPASVVDAVNALYNDDLSRQEIIGNIASFKKNNRGRLQQLDNQEIYDALEKVEKLALGKK